MRYSLLLSALGLGLIGMGQLHGGFALILTWLGLNFLALGLAHMVSLPSLFGKRLDGTLPLWSWIAFLPLHLFTLGTWYLAVKFSPEPAFNEVTPDLVIGRRLLPSEVPGDFVNYIDLTAEFAEPAAIASYPGYRAFPILDASTPHPARLTAFIQSLSTGRTYVHCAQGHGRTALFVIALMLLRGQVGDVEQGLKRLQAERPGLRLNTAQTRFCRKLSS